MKKGIFYSHQGWTDIINCLPLINYYNESYDELIVICREDAKSILDYYVKPLTKVKMYYVSKDLLDANDISLGNVISLPHGYDCLFHGSHDRYRPDKYNQAFERSNDFFVGKFYTCYDIPFENKVKYFELKRDLEKENQCFVDFIKNKPSDYIIYHDDQNSPGGDTGINLESEITKDKKNCYNLNGIIENPFLFVEVLKNAKEIHLVESIWASVVYLLDSKYKLFSDKKVNIYPFKSRTGGLLSSYESKNIIPFQPENWVINRI
jgi:hypothetical protein